MQKSSDDFTIFYAWQSDTPASHNRYLINEAIIEAAARINASEDFPFRVNIDSDTAGTTGLCDIPATILRKLESADAAIVDLTYVASRIVENEDPTRCPNPNVLFELGFSFHAIGCERLICVMNTLHGPASDMLFDIAHRRWPVTFASPVNGKTRRQVVEKLTDDLEPIVRDIIQLGPRTLGVDDDREYLREKSEIETHWLSSRKQDDGWATVTFTIHPKRFRNRRWPSDNDLESLIQSRQIPAGYRGYYPPSNRYTDAMPWGIYNVAYGTPFWAITYAGQFWAALRLNSDSKFPPQNYSTSSEPRDEREDEDYPRTVSAGGWIDFPYSIEQLSDLFRFTGSLAEIYSPNEVITWHCRADGIGGKRIAAMDGSLWRHTSRKCASPYAEAGNQLKAGEFSKKWIEHCAHFCHELFGKFDLLGNRLERTTLQTRIEQLHRRK